MSAFEELGVMPELILALEEMGWTLPTPIQQEAIPLILGGGDVLAAAETGSGKTGAFCLPVLQIAHETIRDDIAPKASSSSSPVVPSGPVGDAMIMNPNDRDSIFAIAADGQLCQARADKAWAGGRAAVGIIRGKGYFEATVTDEGLCRVGFSTIHAARDLGTDKNGYGYGGTGKKSNNRQFDDYGEAFGKNDTIGCCIDLQDTYTIQFFRNNKALGTAFTLPEAVRSGSVAFYPALVLKNAEMKMAFGGSRGALRFPPPAGYTAFADLPSGDTSLGAPKAAASSSSVSTGLRKPVCLIVEPTRELAEQVSVEIEKMKRHLTNPELNHLLLTGGDNSNRGGMLKALSNVDIVVGTGGRIMDMMESGKLDLTNIRFFVLDEADRLIDQSNREMIMKMHKRMTTDGSKPFQMLMFSATLHSPEIKEMAEILTKYPTWIDLKGKDAVPETVHHALIRVDPRAMKSWGPAQSPRVPTDGIHTSDRNLQPSNLSSESLSEGIKKLKPELLVKLCERLKMDQCMIFCRTKVDCDNLESYLVSLGGGSKFKGKVEKGKENAYSCVVLHSDRSVEERRRNLQHFKDGDVRFLICTDVAARGIDIRELPYVINMTLPDKSEDYIHRIGRVGRADAMGLAISFVATEKEKVWYHSCPSRGKSCNNTSLPADGGCAIWYDEPALLGDVEKRLGDMKIVELNSETFELPDAFKGAKYGMSSGAAEEDARAAEKVALLRPSVEQLADLETRAQGSYWMLRQRYAHAQ